MRGIVRGLGVMLGIAMLGWGAPPTLGAQGIVERCDEAGVPQTGLPRSLCEDAAAALQALQPEAGMLLVGGNPVPGTASPLGTRFRFIPRVNVAARINFVFADLPDIIDYPETEGATVGQLGFIAPMPSLDVSVGVFDGFNFAPTVGGLGAVEILGSLSYVVLPGGDGFQDDAAAYGLGARVGVMRESFTAPGVSISALYKWFDRVQFGDADAGDDAQFGTDLRVFSFRAGLSKQFLVLGVAGGLGWDSYKSDVDLAFGSDFSVFPGSEEPFVVVPEDDPAEVSSDRWSGWLNVSYVLLFLNFVGEAGWQASESVRLSTGDVIDSGGFFGSLGVRLSL